MNARNGLRFGLGALGAAGAMAISAAAQAQPTAASFPIPVVDRWMYSYNQFPGMETEVRCFSSLFSPLQSSFDNRDGQFLVAWETSPAVPAGQGLSHYRVLSATVTARVSGDKRFVADNTYDAFNTYLPSDPAYTPDTDVGRPLEMFVCGYRNGWTAQTFAQTGPFAAGAPFPSVARSIRNVYPAQYDGAGVLMDVSNNVEDRIEARPIGVGFATSNADVVSPPGPVSAGDLVPQNTDMVFAVDLHQREALDAIKRGLAGGRVEFVITALAITNQQASTVPRFYTRQWVVANGPDAAAHPAKLEVVVCVGPPGDWNCDHQVQVQDIFDFLADWFSGNGDFNADGATAVQDIFDFLSAWFAG